MMHPPHYKVLTMKTPQEFESKQSQLKLLTIDWLTKNLHLVMQRVGDGGF
jgi:hypothetical protein